MTTITLPPDLEGPLAEEARRRGTTPERLVVDELRMRFAPAIAAASDGTSEPNLADFLAGYIGLVEGSTEPMSERCGERFAQGLAEKSSRGCP